MADTDSTTTRRRRFRYTYVACEKCKARKSKCSGEQPCSRCRDANLTCFYSRTTRFRAPRRSSNATTADKPQRPAVNGTGDQPNQSPEGIEAESHAVQPQATEPTDSSPVSVSSRNDSFEHCLRLAESRFAATSMDANTGLSPGRRIARFGSEQMRQAVANRKPSSPGSVLEVFDVDCWIQILQTYEEEIGLQYPCIDIRQLIGRICHVKASTSQPGSQSANGFSGDKNIDDMAFVLLAIISGFVDPAALDVATPHVEEICGTMMLRTHLNNIELEDLRLLVLVCMFFFLSDREKQAWRVIGVVMRLLQEFSSEADQGIPTEVVPDGLFWSVYTLDRRWSFGTGLPFAVQDVDISRQPPPSNNGDLSSAYLSQMVIFCGIAAEVRTQFLNNPSKCRSTLDAARDLVHFRVVQWQQNLPERLQFHGTQDRFNHTREKRGDYKLRLMLYFRANLMRTIILRKSATRFGLGQLDEASARSMVQIAHDTIRVLSLLVQDTDIYHAQHKTFNHFLETALSALLLVMCSGGDGDGNEPVAGISLGPAKTTSYLKDIVEATELVQRLATCSPITRKLKDKLQGIQKFIDAMMVANSRTGQFQQVQDGPVAYWGISGSTNGPNNGTDHERSPSQNGITAAISMPVTTRAVISDSESNIGISQEPNANMSATSSSQFPLMGSMYPPQAVESINYMHNSDRPPPSSLVSYGPFMTIPDTTDSSNASIPDEMFTGRIMENALADIGVNALADLNGILMDYDNLLF